MSLKILLVSGHRKSWLNWFTQPRRAILLHAKKSHHGAVLGWKVASEQYDPLAGSPHLLILPSSSSSSTSATWWKQDGHWSAKKQSLGTMRWGTQRDHSFPRASPHWWGSLPPEVPQCIYPPFSFQNYFLCPCLKEKGKGLWLLIWTCCLVAQSCPTLCDPMDCSLPGSSVHGILQARILEWFAISSSRGSSQLRDQTQVFCIGRQILYH